MSSDASPSAAARAGLRGSPLAAFFLRETSLFFRGRRSWWGRVSFLLLSALLLFLNVSDATAPIFFGGGGRSAFGVLFAINCYGLFGLINSRFSRTIVEEREEGRLELLRITGLSPFALLVGKGTSQLVRALFLLLLQVPLCVICLVLGQVEISTMLAAYGMLAAVAFFGCHAGLYSSVVSKNARQASHHTLGIFFALIAVPWGILTCHQIWPKVIPDPVIASAMWLRTINPFVAFPSVLAGSGVSWSVVAFYLCGGLVFLGLAVLRFEKFADRAVKTGAEPAVRAALGNRPRRGPLPRVGAWPLAWKEYYFSAGGTKGVRLRWILYPVGVGVAMLIFGTPIKYLSWTDLGQGMLLVGLLGLSSEIPYAATRIFGAEVTNQTLGDIVMLPIAAGRLALEKVLGFVPAILPALALTILGTLLDAGELLRSRVDIALLLGFPYALLSLALVLSLTVHCSFQQPKSAFATAFLLVLLLNGSVFGGCILLFGWSPLLAFVLLAGLTLWGIFHLCRIFPHHLQLAAAK